MSPSKPEKVAILGGGMSALTAAWFLSDPSQGGKYDVTVHQLGWRLGGKGASGRDPACAERIEEHGLHIWFGFYENAFQLMDQCYAELDRTPGTPLASVEDAFKGQNFFFLTEKRPGGAIEPWYIEFPSDRDRPGQAQTLLGLIQLLMGWLHERVSQSPIDASLQESALHERGGADHDHEGFLERIGQWIGEHVVGGVVDLATAFERLANHLLAIPHQRGREEASHHHFSLIVPIIEWIARGIWVAVRDEVATDTVRRRDFIVLYMGLTVIKGIFADDLLRQGLHSIDGLDLREWMYANASIPKDEGGDEANELAFQSAPLQVLYDAAFCYENGNTETPNLAAGIGLRTVLRIVFGYRGSIVSEMQAGMGDTVFTPLYLTLLARGVKFEFFSRVKNLELSSDKKSIAAIEVDRQVVVNSGSYRPLVRVKDLACWPSEPLWDQIEDGDKIRESGVNLEHYEGNHYDLGGTHKLVAGEDYDRVVLGISIACFRDVCGELLDHSHAWRHMVDTLGTVQTQAVQLWFQTARQEMGLKGPPAIIGGYVEPWSSITDFSHLIEREAWSDAENVNFLTYSCGVLLDTEGETQVGEDAAVLKRVEEFLEKDAQPIWPGVTRGKDPAAFDWSTLWAPKGLTGSARLRAQYWRANIDPTEHYVLALKGTGEARLEADQSGYDNLTLTGTWIDNGFNLASIEAAAMSGMQAARAISGFPKKVPGESDA